MRIFLGNLPGNKIEISVCMFTQKIIVLHKLPLSQENVRLVPQTQVMENDYGATAALYIVIGL